MFHNGIISGFVIPIVVIRIKIGRKIKFVNENARKNGFFDLKEYANMVANDRIIRINKGFSHTMNDSMVQKLYLKKAIIKKPANGILPQISICDNKRISLAASILLLFLNRSRMVFIMPTNANKMLERKITIKKYVAEIRNKKGI
jgi:hypothetical protein